MGTLQVWIKATKNGELDTRRVKQNTKTGEISFYCRGLTLSTQAFYDYRRNLKKAWKYDTLVAKMIEIISEDEWNDTYSYMRMREALKFKETLRKAITDITELPTADGKLYISGMFDCLDLVPIGLVMADNMRVELRETTVKQVAAIYGKSAINGLISHSDRGPQ